MTDHQTEANQWLDRAQHKDPETAAKYALMAIAHSLLALLPDPDRQCGYSVGGPSCSLKYGHTTSHVMTDGRYI